MQRTIRFRYCIVGICLLAIGCTAQSDQQLRETPREVNAQIDQLLRLGDQTRQGGDMANAIGFYQRAYSLDPKNRLSLLTLSQALEDAGDRRAAERLLAEALKAEPSDVELLRRHANVLIKLDRIVQARLQLEKALTLQPDEPALHNSLGVALDLQGFHDQAQDHYKKVDGLAGVNNLALSLALDGRYEDAIKLLAPYENDLSLPTRYRLNLALIYGLKGDEASAARVAGYVLDKEAVDHNLAIYKDLRALDDQQRARKVLGGAN